MIFYVDSIDCDRLLVDTLVSYAFTDGCEYSVVANIPSIFLFRISIFIESCRSLA